MGEKYNLYNRYRTLLRRYILRLERYVDNVNNESNPLFLRSILDDIQQLLKTIRNEGDMREAYFIDFKDYLKFRKNDNPIYIANKLNIVAKKLFKLIYHKMIYEFRNEIIDNIIELDNMYLRLSDSYIPVEEIDIYRGYQRSIADTKNEALQVLEELNQLFDTMTSDVSIERLENAYQRGNEMLGRLDHFFTEATKIIKRLQH